MSEVLGKLQEARDLLVEKTWIKDRMFEYTFVPEVQLIGACMNGSVQNCVGKNTAPLYGKCLGELAQTIDELFPDRPKHMASAISDAVVVASFNDHEDTTFGDVMEVFDETIRRVKEQAA